MILTKTIQKGGKELADLLPTPQGRSQIEELVSRHVDAGGHTMAPGTSLITLILICERERGLTSI
jgi:hypothetical protein